MNKEVVLLVLELGWAVNSTKVLGAVATIKQEVLVRPLVCVCVHSYVSVVSMCSACFVKHQK